MKRNLFFVALATTVVVSVLLAYPTQQHPPAPIVATGFAVAVVVPAEGSHVSGTIHFVESNLGVNVAGEISGLEPNSVHGFHIHEFGDISSKDGMSLGGHFNPMKMSHGLPGSKDMHAGDLGNITADANGVAHLRGVYSDATITSANSILGRGIVVHAKPDDGGQPTGNAGGRIAFGVIGLAKEMAH